MDISTRIEILKLYYSLGESATAALRGCKTKHGLIKDPFTVSTIARLIAKFESTGSGLDFPAPLTYKIFYQLIERLLVPSKLVSSGVSERLPPPMRSYLLHLPESSVNETMATTTTGRQSGGELSPMSFFNHGYSNPELLALKQPEPPTHTSVFSESKSNENELQRAALPSFLASP
ncbi:hypothetical protein T265_07252 [Opisthorchis viverrini]|uniref:DUF4817 domain-containing protein n=1 Tax=Opisthorchis viverrini TaxID=6198 RepID=A0A074ZDL7_OPIVI|nr:hypothetical protein T265_07252 [Opisthorchis viverrini]KER25268.1 hypothetical protein T265_07252 [Opisthorchis viverrini]